MVQGFLTTRDDIVLRGPYPERRRSRTLPVEQPSRFYLTITETAKAIGLSLQGHF